MKLTLTIQDVEDKKTKTTFLGLFGSLTTDQHVETHKKLLKQYNKNYLNYSKAVQENEETREIEPIKPEVQTINFVTTLKDVRGLEAIVNNIIKEATKL